MLSEFTLLTTPTDALELLKSLGAPKRLIRHLELVGEAAEDLIKLIQTLGIPFDDNFVRLGVAVHDAGKILHPNELSNKGSAHEPDGERLLLDNGVQSDIARCCLSHARFKEMDVSFEELLVALSDKLWKGKRVEELELRVIDHIGVLLKKDRWDVFEILDSGFETIASHGDERLSRSRV